MLRDEFSGRATMAINMISHAELARLAALQSEEGIVSTYIKVDPRLMYAADQAVAKFKGAVKRFTRRAKEDRWLAALERERDRILSFLEDWQPRGRSLVIFSCRPAGIWEVVSLEVLVPTWVTVDTTTHTAMLTQVLDEYPRFVIALLQKDKAQIYIAEQRTLEEGEEIASHVPGRHDQGGWAQARFQRHIDFHAAKHLRKVVDELEQLYYDQPFKRLAVGGAQDAVNELLKLLPDPLSRRVIGTFPVDFKHETEEEILERARGVWEEEERRSEQELVERLVDAAKSAGQAAIGIDETLQAVLEGRVRELVVAEGVTKEGSACLECDHLAAEDFARCPVCGGEAEATPDVVERAVERAYLAGAHVETVFGKGREWLLAHGGLGALLRY